MKNQSFKQQEVIDDIRHNPKKKIKILKVKQSNKGDKKKANK